MPDTPAFIGEEPGPPPTPEPAHDRPAPSQNGRRRTSERTHLQPATATETPPPQNLAAEEYVLGALLLNDSILPAVSELVDPADFYRASHGHIYRAILALHAKDQPFDPISVIDELEKAGRLDDTLTRERVYELAAAVPATTNAPHHATLIRETATLRALQTAAKQLDTAVRQRTGDATELLQQTQDRLDEIRQRKLQLDDTPLLTDAHDFITMQLEEPLPLWGTKTTTLLPAGGLAIFAGRPGVGKTTFLLDLLCHLACGLPYPPPSDDKAPDAFPVPRPLRIALIENEGPIAMFRDKLLDKLLKLGTAGHQIREAGGYLAVQTWRWGAFNFADADAFQKAKDELDQHQIDLVVGDPLGMLGVEGVGSPADTRAFVQILRRLGLGTTRSFLFLHHFRERAEKNEDEMARVSGAWNTHLDTLITLSAMGQADQARLAFPKVRWSKEKPPEPIVLGRVFNTASFEALRQEGDLTLLEPVLVEFLQRMRKQKRGASGQGWYTATELAATMKEHGDGRRRADIQKALTAGQHLFVSRTGQDAKALGKRTGSAVLWGLREWEQAALEDHADDPFEDTEPPHDDHQEHLL